MRNWSASLSELPTAITLPTFTSFSLGLSMLLVSTSWLGPIVCTWPTQLLLSPSLPLSPPAHPTLTVSPCCRCCCLYIHTTGLSCQMPLPLSQLLSKFPSPKRRSKTDINCHNFFPIPDIQDSFLMLSNSKLAVQTHDSQYIRKHFQPSVLRCESVFCSASVYKPDFDDTCHPA